MKLKTFRIYSEAIGRPDGGYYKAREDFGTIEAESKMRALDAVAEKIGATRIARKHSIPVLGVGSITVEEVSE